ncbi:MAG: hypothetical protein WD851_19410 [Pirellulales bacterium]
MLRELTFVAASLIPLAHVLADEPAATRTAPRAEARETTPTDAQEEAIFSGPQIGEKLPPLPVSGVFDDAAGKELDFVQTADGKPIVLVFLHEMNRPSIGFTRALTSYTVKRQNDGLTTGVVWLDDDATEAENTLKRIRHALTPDVPIAISHDGKEGPGSYGLNRNVALTILVGNEGKVTDNFALVQPSVQADLPRVFEAIVRVAGGEVPKLEDVLGTQGRMRRGAAGEPDPRLRELLGPVIRLNATEEAVNKAAAKVEAYAAENENARQEIGRIANTIVNSGKLDNYGTPRAREFISKWAKEYAPVSRDARRGGQAPSSERSAGSENPPQ